MEVNEPDKRISKAVPFVRAIRKIFVAAGLLAAIYSAVAISLLTDYPPASAVRGLLMNQTQETQEKGGDYWIERISDEKTYFVHIRHTKRLYFEDGGGFDVLELESLRHGEDTKFAPAFCLEPEGVLQAELLGWAFERADLVIADVWSSPSCRARQTADLAFGSEYRVDTVHLYRGAIPETEREEFFKAQRLFFEQFEPSEEGLSVIVGHEPLAYDLGGLEVERLDGEVARQEGGISILSYDTDSNKLIVHYSFATVTDFIMSTPRERLSAGGTKHLQED